MNLCVRFAILSIMFGTSMCAINVEDSIGRIYGGKIASPAQFPYQVSLQTIGYLHFCGGSILNNRWILTAAHCPGHKFTANALRVLAGTNNVDDRSGRYYNVQKIVYHEEYDFEALRNDIAMLKTVQTIIMDRFSQPVPLSRRFAPGNVIAMSTGWGSTGTAVHQFYSPVLLYITVKTVSNKECFPLIPEIYQTFFNENNLCTLPPQGLGSCAGDSGGPLVNLSGELIGLVSWGTPDCGVGNTDQYTRVGNYLDWIETTIQSN